MAPVDALAVPVGEGVERLAREGAGERAEADAGSRAGAPAEAVDRVGIVEPAAVLHALDGSRGGGHRASLGFGIGRIGGTRETERCCRTSGRENGMANHRSLLVWH